MKKPIINEKTIITERISKVFILIGILSFISYFIVRMYAIYINGAGEFYGVRLFMPDRFPLITAICSSLVLFGFCLYLINKKFAESKQALM